MPPLESPLLSPIDSSDVPSSVLDEVQGLTRTAIDNIAPLSHDIGTSVHKQIVEAASGPIATKDAIHKSLADQINYKIGDAANTVRDISQSLMPAVTVAASEQMIRCTQSQLTCTDPYQTASPIPYDQWCNYPRCQQCDAIVTNPGSQFYYCPDTDQSIVISPDGSVCWMPQTSGIAWAPGGCGKTPTIVPVQNGPTPVVNPTVGPIITPPGGGSDTVSVLCPDGSIGQQTPYGTLCKTGQGGGSGQYGDTTTVSGGPIGTGGLGGTGQGQVGGVCDLSCGTVNLTLNVPVDVSNVITQTLPLLVQLLGCICQQMGPINVLQNQMQDQSQQQSQQQTQAGESINIFPALGESLQQRLQSAQCCPTKAELVDLWTAKFYPRNMEWVRHALDWSVGPYGSYLQSVYAAPDAVSALAIIDAILEGH